jgi:hypothetical protein
MCIRYVSIVIFLKNEQAVLEDFSGTLCMTLLEGQMKADLVTSTGKPSGCTRIGFTRTSLKYKNTLQLNIQIQAQTEKP